MTPSAVQTILIVDDEIQNRELFENLLRLQGYGTLTAANGEEALKAIAEHSPDLILLDIMMPGIDGYELAVVLKADSVTSNIPIIMVSAHIDCKARLGALNAGAEEFLSKPVDPTELWLRVRNLLRLKTFSELQKQAHARLQERTAQLEASNQELQAFAYSVSHDLRTPLSSIAGFSNLLQREIDKNSGTERAMHYLSRINTGARQMSASIDALLLLTQVSRTDICPQRVDLSAMAQVVLDGYLEREPDRLVRIDIEPDLLVQGDPNLLGQLLDNLLGNAWKFSSQQAQVHVIFSSATHADGKTVYAIKDNGSGFDMAYSDKLFAPFERLHSVSEFPGTGIGLATVHRIVARHGGKVWAESAPGCGATFYFTLGV